MVLNLTHRALDQMPQKGPESMLAVAVRLNSLGSGPLVLGSYPNTPEFQGDPLAIADSEGGFPVNGEKNRVLGV